MGSKPHQRVCRTSMQAAKLSEEDGVSSSQLPELEDEPCQAKTAKMCMPVSRDDEVPRLTSIAGLALVVVVLVLVLMMVGPNAQASNMFPWLLEKVTTLLLLLLPLPLLLYMLMSRHDPFRRLVVLGVALTLDRVMNFYRACMHRRGGRLMKWGPHEWVLDSGAWNHHTSNLALLIEGGDFESQERGSVRTDCFDFPGVHYVVGDDTRNVVSVSQLARDHKLVTVFEPTSCHVMEKKTGKIVGKGRLRNGTYILDSLRIVGQYVAGDRGASSGGEHGDGGGEGRGHGGGGSNNGEEGDSGMADGRGGGGRSRDSRPGGTGASRNQEQGSSGSGASGGDVKDEEIIKNEEEGGTKNEIQEMDDENVDNGHHQEINGNGEDEDKKRGGSNFGESSNKACMGLSVSACVWRLCIAACILLLLCTRTGTGVISKLATFNNHGFHSLLGFSFLFILRLQLLRTLGMMESTSHKLVKQIGSLFRGRGTDREGKEEGTTGDHYVQESPQEHNRRLYGLSRFTVTTDPTGCWRRKLPARAFPSSTNTARQEDFFVDSGASFHTTWKESILFPYPQHLRNHTKPPTLSLGGIAAGSIAVTRTGYLNGNKIMLDGVLLAPQAQANLVSVGQLSIYYGVQVEMDEVGVVIKKKRDGAQIGGGKMLNNLYVLEYFQPGGLFAHSPTPHL